MSHPLNPDTAPSLNADEILRHIESDITLCTQLLSTLQEEQSALKNRDVEAVEALIEKKVPILEALEQSAKLRQSWSLTAGSSEHDEAQWTTMLSSLGNSPVKKQWDKLKSLYAQVRDQNEINGKLLSRHQGTLNRLLDIMRGKTASPSVYNATGYSSSKSQSNTLGEA